MWKSRTLGEVCDETGGIIQTGPFGSQLHESDYVSDGVPVVMPKNILDGKIDTSDIAFILEDDAERLKRHRMSVGDIVYGRRGDIGRRGIVAARENGWLCGTGCLRVSLGDRVLNPTYLYYFLGQPAVVGWIANQAVGATMPNLNTGILRSVVVSYPRLPIQRRIASILSAYDGLIENNTRRIKILEEMAQIIYREWFVNFRFPGHENFNMVESDLGMIPDGWAVRTLDALMDFQGGAQPPKSEWLPEPSDGYLRMIQIRDYESDAHLGFVKDSGKLQKCTALDIMIARYGASVARICWGLTGAYNVALVKVLPTEPYHREFLRSHLRSDSFQSLLIGMSGRTAQAGFNKTVLKSITLILPLASELFARYEDVARPLRELILRLRSKNSNLRTTRNFLLPKLISGEVSVEAAEEAALELVG